MKLALVFLLGLSCCFFYSEAVLGVDVSIYDCPNWTVDDWRCVANAGYEFAILETWNGGLTFNERIDTCVERAKAGGIKQVELYAFFCDNCPGNVPASSAMDTLLTKLDQKGVHVDRIWIDVEQCPGCWKDCATNTDYIHGLVNTAQGRGQAVGIYASAYEWQATVCSPSSFSSLPLWWATYDNQPNMNGFSSFGGWHSPHIHQYTDIGPCKLNADRNFKASL
jgi:GH25 family lysozyme M1 (1,4-beta-N-acetylmuramidase)